MIKINLIKIVKDKIYFLLKSDLIDFALQKEFIIKESLTKGEVIEAILSNITDELALELTNKFSDKIGFTASEIEELLGITKYERKKWTRKGYLNVTGTYEVRAYGKYLNCPLYDVIQIINLTNEDIKKWRSENKATKKQIKALEQGRKTMIENRTCKRCNSIQTHKNKLIDNLCVECHSQLEHLKWLKEQKQKAKENFKKWAENRENYLILDSETTGLESDDEIIELAIIDLHGNTLFHSMFKPTKPITPGAYEVHGISNNELKDKPRWSEMYKIVHKIIKDKTLLIYNADFDIRMLLQTNDLHGVYFDIPNYECVMKNYASIHSYYSEKYKDFKWISLEDATNCYQNHRAKDDCLLVLELINKETLKGVGING